MIVLSSFTEMVEQYRLGLIPFRLLQEQVAVLIGICENPHAAISDGLDVTEADIEWLSAQPEAEEDYDGFLGGDVHICQSPEDLLSVEGFDAHWTKTHDGRVPNVTDLPMSWDSCRYVSERDEKPNWVGFFLASNNGGGPVYFVPKPFWGLARVVEHMTSTQQFWDKAVK